jgi:hypothetical protein
MTIYLRYLIGFAFVFASFVKIEGKRFTQLPASDPVGHFFESMYQTGFYWQFLGWSQFIAGSLLVTQRFASLGAMVFFPVILNVCVITHSINFGMGTPLITSLMLLGTIYLLLWDYKKWFILFQRDKYIKLDLTSEQEDMLMTDPVWTYTGILFVVMSIIPEIFGWRYLAAWVLVMLAIGIGAFAIVMRKRKQALIMTNVRE